MIKAKCPKCDECIKVEDWQEGMFHNCLCCDNRFQCRNTSDRGTGSYLTYNQFSWLLHMDFNYIYCLFIKELDIVIRTRWTDNCLLEFYAHNSRSPELELELVEIFTMIIKEKTYMCRKLNQRYICMIR